MPSISKLLLSGLVLGGSAIASPIGGTTRYKANEYKSSDWCVAVSRGSSLHANEMDSSGPINYQHWSALLNQVTMDDTSHSVYLASPWYQWVAYDAKSRDGGGCGGEQNLQQASSRRLT